MEQNKTGKYFKYAIGEIILVVIGILIALQINNWNENRKLKTQEIEILKSFKSSINRDLIGLQEAMVRYNRSDKSINYLIDYLEQDLPYKDSLSFHFGNISSDWGIDIDRSIFETLKSKGFNLISNDSLKQDIIKFYSHAEGELGKLTSRYTAIIEDASKTIYRKHFDAIWEPSSREQYDLENINNSVKYIGKMTPIDFTALKKDREFMYFLKSLRNQQHWLIRRQGIRLDENLTSILNTIENELEK